MMTPDVARKLVEVANGGGLAGMTDEAVLMLWSSVMATRKAMESACASGMPGSHVDYWADVVHLAGMADTELNDRVLGHAKAAAVALCLKGY